MDKYIVVNRDGLYVRAQKTTLNNKNILRKMSCGEGFTVYETYTVKGMSGNQLWGRVSENPGGVSQEYACLKIGNNKIYAERETPPATSPEEWLWNLEKRMVDMENWARSQGYKG